MSKYSVEEVREWKGIAESNANLYTKMTGAHEPWTKLAGMLADLLERIKADARPVAQGEAAWLERLKDPATVHALMLRGVIAIPSIRSMVDLRGEVPNGEEVQLLRIAELQEQLAAQPRAVPDGMVLVPRELTREMFAAGFRHQYGLSEPEPPNGYFDIFNDWYKAMLAAAPSPGEPA